MTTDVELFSLPTRENFNDLLDALYGSLTDNQGFENFLGKLKDRFNSVSATLMAIQTEPRQMRWGFRVGIPERIERWYIDNDMVCKDPSIDLFEEISKTQPGFVAASLRLTEMDLVDVVSDDFRHWLIGAEIIDTTGLMFPATDNEYLILALQRSQPAGRFRQEEINHLNILAPHIKQALQLFIRIYRQHSDHTSLQAAIDSLARPTIVINEMLQIRHINAAAVATLQHHADILIRKGRLMLQDEKLHSEFMSRIAQMAHACRNPAQEPSSILAIPGAPDPVTITLSPMLSPGCRTGCKGILLQIFDPASQSLPKAAMIQVIFRLTPAEAILCEYLVQGCTLKDIARTRGVSVNTVREQIRNIFSKTGYSRQSDLIASILRVIP